MTPWELADMTDKTHMIALDCESYEPADIDALPRQEQGAERLLAKLKISSRLKRLTNEELGSMLIYDVLERLPMGTIQHAIVDEAISRLLPDEDE